MTKTRQKKLICSLFFGAVSLPYTAGAQTVPSSSELSRIFACQSESNPTLRLQCYDKAVSEFETKEKSGDVVTINKNQVEEFERDAFGFNIPSLPKLGKIFNRKPKTKLVKKDSDLTNEVKTATSEAKTTKPNTKTPIETKKDKSGNIKSIRFEIEKTTNISHGKIRFFLKNGQVWEQIDSKNLRVPKIRNGIVNTAKISKASLGSFMLRVNDKSPTIRVRRVR